MIEIFEAIHQAGQKNETSALLTVVRAVGSTPRHAAAKMLVRADGSFVGTIGGGSMEKTAIQNALTVLQNGANRLAEYSLIGKTPNSVGLCGGTQEVFIDILKPADEVIFSEILKAYTAREPVALITVINSYKGCEWQAGQKLLFTSNGPVLKNAADTLFDARLAAHAQAAIKNNRPLRLGYQPKTNTFTLLNNIERYPLEFFIDVLQPKAELMIIGAGHIGLALLELGKLMDMRTIVVDDRPAWIERSGGADETLIVSYAPETETLKPMPINISAATHIVVATWGWDGPALAQVIHSPANYIGLVASQRKAKFIFESLVKKGISKTALQKVYVPAGLDLGAETPPEIALSIMAQIMQNQRGASGKTLKEIKGQTL